MKKYLLPFIILQIFLFSNLLFAQNKNAIIETSKIADNIYKFELNKFVNVFAFIGPEGVLLVDSGFDKNPSFGFINSPESIKAELKKISNDNIKYIINTHTDGDHAFGNSELGTNAIIISHQLGRDRLLNSSRYPKEALPNITFQDSMKIYFNNEEITLYYLPGHSNHDIVIYFKKAGVVFTGDLIIPDTFGAVGQTGDVNKLIKSIDWLYNNFSDEVIFAAAHDHTLKRENLKNYKIMIEKTLEIVTKEINNDRTLDEMQKNDILKEWKTWNGKYLKTIDANNWILMLYMNIIKKFKPSASEKLNDILIKSSFQDAKEEIQSLIKKKKEYYFLENEFNALGYTLMNNGKLKDAIEVFKLNVELYPNAWNTYDSLAEGYMNDGKKELAIENYEKSLKINPNNNSATQQLEKLKK